MRGRCNVVSVVGCGSFFLAVGRCGDFFDVGRCGDFFLAVGRCSKFFLL